MWVNNPAVPAVDGTAEATAVETAAAAAADPISASVAKIFPIEYLVQVPVVVQVGLVETTIMAEMAVAAQMPATAFVVDSKTVAIVVLGLPQLPEAKLHSAVATTKANSVRWAKAVILTTATATAAAAAAATTVAAAAETAAAAADLASATNNLPPTPFIPKVTEPGMARL